MVSKLSLLLMVVVFVAQSQCNEQYTVCKSVESYFQLGEPSTNESPPPRVGKAGPKGDKGDTGLQGVTGELGPKGAAGEQGQTGSKGDMGLPGPTGELGPQGVAGERGQTGSKGDKGDMGLPGPAGELGPQGVAGEQGLTGYKGDMGLPGPAGELGLQGVAGERGQTGSKGEPGEDRTNTAEIEALKEQVNNLPEHTAEIEALKEQVNNLAETVAYFMKTYRFEYKLSSSVMTWSNARQYCQSLGGELAVHGMKSMQRRREIMEDFADDMARSPNVWIGITDEANHNTWLWLDGSNAASNVYWIDGQPDNNGGSQHYVAIDKSEDWKARDLAATDICFALCEIPL